MVRRGLVPALVLTALMGVYVWLVLTRVIALLGMGEPVGIVLGLAFGILPLLVLWYIVAEWLLATRVQRLADELAATDELPVDTLPRSPGGRIDRAAASAQFETVKAQVEAEPERWQGWFNLGFAYDAAGDRRRARAALRKAVALYRAG
ncbi:MAG: hypothetical protein GX593_11640 [Actinomycetales bacterium]|nr:hypothetical protein [Actinomycetales bacterium]